MPASRTTISFNEKNWSKVKKASNKSAYVNKAVAFFISAQKLLKKKEEEVILRELEHFANTGESYSLKDALK